MRFIPTYRQTLYLVLALGLLIATANHLHNAPGDRIFLTALAFSAAVLGLRELLTDIMTADTGDPR